MPDSCGIITSRMSRSKESPRIVARADRGVHRGRDAEAMVLEIAREQIADAAIVVDDEDVGRVVFRPRPRCGLIAVGMVTSLPRCRLLRAEPETWP